MSSIEWPEGTLFALLEHYGWTLPSPRPGWQTVKCGAHKDSHASCRVNDQVGAAKCQACDFGGDLVKIVRFYEGEGMPFHEVVQVIERATGNSSRQIREGVRGRRSASSLPSRSRNKSADGAFVSPRLRGRSHAR